MSKKGLHNAWLMMRITALVLFFAVIALPSFAQNTKGDKSVGNQRQIRETKAKSVKRKEKAKTKDIAGRRLRTKDKSSGSRANANHRQPNPYSSRPRVKTDRAAKPTVRIYSKSPRSKERSWKGDVSGSPVRRVKPRTAEAARKNIYPQRGAYVNNPSRKPRGESKPRTYKRTASGQPVVHRVPKQKQRAWKGDIRGGAIGSPSATGSIKNEFHQKNKYSRYSGREHHQKERGVSNRGVLSRAARLSSTPGFRRGQSFPSSGSRSYVQRGRKNAYWGKYSKGERAVTTDIAGRPLRTKNYRSLPAGLVGRDTLKFFGRRPSGDQKFSGKSRKGRLVTGSPKGNRGWQGDVSGSKLRRQKPHTIETAGKMFYPRKFSVSKSGERGKPIPGSGFQSRSKPPGGTPGRPITEFSPGRNTKKLARAFSRIKGNRPIKGGGSVSGKTWNNGRSPIDPKIPPMSGQRAGKFQGNIRRGDKSFANQGEGFSGYIKARRPVKGGGSVSGKTWNNGRSPIDPKIPPMSGQRAGKFQGNIRAGQKSFANQGEGFSGYIKARRPVKGGGSVSGKTWNNGRSPIDPKIPPMSGQRAGKFQGNIRAGQKSFANQGEGFSGYIKTRRPVKGGGSVSGKLWNNKGKPIDVADGGGGTIKASKFQGNIKTGRPAKGGGSVSGKLWNNKGEPIDVYDGGKGTVRASQFQGNIKAKRPAKGGGSVSGKLWNNKGEPIDVYDGGKGTVRASKFQGNVKAKRPATGGGGSISFKLWNNNEKPIQVRVPDSDAREAGYTGKRKMRKAYEQNPNSHKLSVLKQKPDKTTFRVDGLQVRVKRADFEKKPNAADNALKGLGPTKNAVKASEYARGLKVMWNTKHNPRSVKEALDGRKPGRVWENGIEHAGNRKLKYPYKHNPNSADDALKVTYLGKAYGRIEDFQGNTKMRKYNDRRLHPDAKFAHHHQDNVKEERTILTNVKLLWSKLFKKSDTQPEHLKKKERRPRYDKREQGLWYD